MPVGGALVGDALDAKLAPRRRAGSCGTHRAKGGRRGAVTDHDEPADFRDFSRGDCADLGSVELAGVVAPGAVPMAVGSRQRGATVT